MLEVTCYKPRKGTETLLARYFATSNTISIWLKLTLLAANTSTIWRAADFMFNRPSGPAQGSLTSYWSIFFTPNIRDQMQEIVIFGG